VTIRPRQEKQAEESDLVISVLPAALERYQDFKALRQ
jgi:hypothetical protein